MPLTINSALAFDGVTQPIVEWALDYGIPATLIVDRLEQDWSVERAITTPMPTTPGMKLPASSTRKQRGKCGRPPRAITLNGKTMIIDEWAKLLGIKPGTIRQRLSEGQDAEEALRPTRTPRQHRGAVENFSNGVGDRRGEARAGSPSNRSFVPQDLQ